MLKRVRVRGYKSLVDLDIALRPLTVLFGPNAAGKSNFLDALQLLSRVVTSRTLQEAFEPPPRPLEEIEADIKAVEQDILKLLKEVAG